MSQKNLLNAIPEEIQDKSQGKLLISFREKSYKNLLTKFVNLDIVAHIISGVGLLKL